MYSCYSRSNKPNDIGMYAKLTSRIILNQSNLIIGQPQTRLLVSSVFSGARIGTADQGHAEEAAARHVGAGPPSPAAGSPPPPPPGVGSRSHRLAKHICITRLHTIFLSVPTKPCHLLKALRERALNSSRKVGKPQELTKSIKWIAFEYNQVIVKFIVGDLQKMQHQGVLFTAVPTYIWLVFCCQFAIYFQWVSLKIIFFLFIVLTPMFMLTVLYSQTNIKPREPIRFYYVA